MLSDPDAAGVVDGIRYRSRHCPDGRLAETFYSIEPARLQDVDEDLRLLFRNIHDRREPVRQIADAVVTCPWKLAIPRNRIGCKLRALDQGSMQIGFGGERI